MVSLSLESVCPLIQFVLPVDLSLVSSSFCLSLHLSNKTKLCHLIGIKSKIWEGSHVFNITRENEARYEFSISNFLLVNRCLMRHKICDPFPEMISQKYIRCILLEQVISHKRQLSPMICNILCSLTFYTACVHSKVFIPSPCKLLGLFACNNTLRTENQRPYLVFTLKLDQRPIFDLNLFPLADQRSIYLR